MTDSQYLTSMDQQQKKFRGRVLVGAGGKRYFEFEVTEKVASGSDCHIGFQYARVWEANDNWASNPDKMLRIHIN